MTRTSRTSVNAMARDKPDLGPLDFCWPAHVEIPDSRFSDDRAAALGTRSCPIERFMVARNQLAVDLGTRGEQSWKLRGMPRRRHPYRFRSCTPRVPEISIVFEGGIPDTQRLRSLPFV